MSKETAADRWARDLPRMKEYVFGNGTHVTATPEQMGKLLAHHYTGIDCEALMKALVMFLDPDYRRDPKTEHYCIRCQKDITGAHRRVYLRQDAITVLHPNDVATHCLPGDLGWQSIGNDCARFLGAGWTVDTAMAITTAAEHKAAMKRFKSLWAAEPGTPEHLELERLAEAISAWEQQEMSK